MPLHAHCQVFLLGGGLWGLSEFLVKLVLQASLPQGAFSHGPRPQTYGVRQTWASTLSSVTEAKFHNLSETQFPHL